MTKRKRPPLSETPGPTRAKRNAAIVDGVDESKQRGRKPSTNRVQFKRRNLALTERGWDGLDRLANHYNTRARGGPKRGRVSWRTLIAMISENADAIIAASPKNRTPSLVSTPPTPSTEPQP